MCNHMLFVMYYVLISIHLSGNPFVTNLYFVCFCLHTLAAHIMVCKSLLVKFNRTQCIKTLQCTAQHRHIFFFPFFVYGVVKAFFKLYSFFFSLLLTCLKCLTCPVYSLSLLSYGISEHTSVSMYSYSYLIEKLENICKPL